jgi:carbon storage regulator CsrA
MLVLSRRKGEKILFPNIGVELELLKVQGNTARLGIAAPPHVKILRDELSATSTAAGIDNGDSGEPAGQHLSHEMRNRLNKATLALQLLRKQLERGHVDHAESLLQNLLFEFASLDKQSTSPPAASPSANPIFASTLIVEDDRNESALLAGFLRINGFDVAEACDGADALEYLSTNELPDLVLLDMLMPRCNGRQTIDAIRQSADFRELKVIAISGTSPAELGVHIGPNGVDRWFQKPINPETLLREIMVEMSSVA